MSRHKGKFALAVVVALVVVLDLTGAFPDLPDTEEVIEGIATGLGEWTYLLVGLLAFLETGAFVGLVAPGETAVIVGGVIAGQGEIALVPLIGVVWLACVLGDSTSFLLGRRLGRGFLLRHGPKIRVDAQRLAQVESYFDRHGGKTILIGRFIGLVRAVSPFIAGSSGLTYRRFIPFSIIGCGAWATLFCVLGYLFYGSLDRVTAIVGQAAFTFGTTVVVVVGTVYAWRRLRHRHNRRALAAWVARQGRRPALRPLVAVLAPVWRRVIGPAVAFARPRLGFLRDRLTPGDLGLELTSFLAVAAVGLYFFVVYATVVGGSPSPTPMDRELLGVAEDLRVEGVVDVVKAVTGLGAPVTVVVLVLWVTVLLVVRREREAAVALVVGAVLLFAAVRLAKEGIDRPRPPDGLVGADGFSFPSGHAAYSTLWVAVALALSRCLPGIGRRAVLVGAAVGIAVVVGLSRVYLRVHYWSDVAGGWGLGAGILGVCAAVALTVGYIRQNGGQATADPPP